MQKITGTLVGSSDHLGPHTANSAKLNACLEFYWITAIFVTTVVIYFTVIATI